MSKRSSGLVAYLPGTSMRVMIRRDGSFELGGGRVITPALDGRTPGAVDIFRGDREIEWRASHGKFRVSGRVVAAPTGAAFWIEIANPYSEAREVEFAMNSSPAGASLVAIPGASAREGAATSRVLLPPMGRGAIEATIPTPPRAGVAEFGASVSAADAVWDRALGEGGSCSLPAAALDKSFKHAMGVLRGCMCSGSEGEASLWPRPGLVPEAGPVTLDALALAALAEWGAVGDYRAALEWSLARTEDRVIESPRAVWGSDRGALLWAAAAGLLDAGRFAEEVSGLVEQRAEVLLKEKPCGRAARMKGPRVLGREAGAWNDGWTWKGLAAAAAILECAGASSASSIRRAAEDYRDGILRAYCERPNALYCLGRLGVIGKDDPGRDDEEDLFHWADGLANARQAEHEFRTSVFFLRSLRSRLIGEGSDRIVLLDGVEPEWFREGGRLDFRNLPVGRGRVSASVFVRREGALISVESSGCRRMHLRIPPRTSGETDVKIDGRRVKASGGIVPLPPGHAWNISV